MLDNIPRPGSKATTADMMGPKLGIDESARQVTADGIDTIWTEAAKLVDVMQFLKTNPVQNFPLLLDITAVDERVRTHRPHKNSADFTVVYHLLCPEGGVERRIKVPLFIDSLTVPSLCALWSNANWYEREVWDMFGIHFAGHPDLRRMLMPESWVGHPLRKDHFSRATEQGPFVMPDAVAEAEQSALQNLPTFAGLTDISDDDPDDDSESGAESPQLAWRTSPCR